MRVLLSAAITLFLSITASQARDGTSLPPPEPNLPWEHQPTEFRLPAEIEGLIAEEVFQFPEAALGYSVRYSDTEARLRADIYVYPCGQKAKTAEEIKEAIRDTAGQAIWEVEEMGRRGHYKSVKQGEAAYTPFDLLPEGTGVSALLTLPFQYQIVEATDAGKSDSKVGSLLAIMVLREHFVKVRLTHPIYEDEKEKAELEKRLKGFVNRARRCVFDPGVRPEMLGHVKTYRQSPISETGHDAAAALLAYAEFTPLIELTFDDKIVEMGADMQKEYPNASEEMLRAFIVGAVAESLKKPGPKAADLHQAGAEEVLQTFGKMQEKQPGLASARMSELKKLVADKKAADYFREPRAKKKKR